MMNLVPSILSAIHGETRVCQLRREGLQTQLSVDVGGFLAISECGPGFDLVSKVPEMALERLLYHDFR